MKTINNVKTGNPRTNKFNKILCESILDVILFVFGGKISVSYVMNQMRNQPVQETQNNYLASDC
jgi:hypothetical protein